MELSQSSFVCIIANQTPFKAGGLQHFFMNGRKSHPSDPSILDAVTHCQ